MNTTIWLFLENVATKFLLVCRKVNENAKINSVDITGSFAAMGSP